MYDMAKRLREARLRAGYKDRVDAANRVGIAYQTLVAHESTTKESNRKPKPEALQRYANAYKVSLEWLLGGTVIGYGDQQKLVNQQSKLVAPNTATTAAVPVLDVVAAGKWSEPDLLVQEPSVFIELGGAAAYRIEGTSMNRIARDGDIVLCKPWHGIDRTPRNNDLLIVERRRGDLVERTLKRFRDGALHCESSDPRWKDISLPFKDGDQVKVLALAVALHREL